MQKKKRKSCLLLWKVTRSYLVEERAFGERTDKPSLLWKACSAFDQCPRTGRERKRRHTYY